MNECMGCGRLVDKPGACDECRSGQRSRKTKTGTRVNSTTTVGKKWGEATRSRIIEMTKTGKSTAGIAREIGCSQRMIGHVRQQARADGRLV